MKLKFTAHCVEFGVFLFDALKVVCLHRESSPPLYNLKSLLKTSDHELPMTSKTSATHSQPVGQVHMHVPTLLIIILWLRNSVKAKRKLCKTSFHLCEPHSSCGTLQAVLYLPSMWQTVPSSCDSLQAGSQTSHHHHQWDNVLKIVYRPTNEYM